MKTIEEILGQTPVYLNNWEDKIGVIADFEDIYMTSKEYLAFESPYSNVQMWETNKRRMAEAIEKWQPINILFASYGSEGYEGDAFVLFEREGELFEVSGSHCSCYGLEGQFDPEKTTLEAIAYRLVNGTWGMYDYSGNIFAKELREFIGL